MNCITAKLSKSDTSTAHLKYQKENIHGILDLLFITLANNFQLFTGIKEVEAGKSAISIHPNPANSMITIEHSRNDPFILMIYDVLGSLIYHQENLEQVDLQSISPGSYIMQFRYKDQVISRTLVIHR